MAQIKNRRAPIFVDSQDNVVSGGLDFSLVYNEITDVSITEKVISFTGNTQHVLLFVDSPSAPSITITINNSLSVASASNKFTSVEIEKRGGRLFSNYSTTSQTYGTAVSYTRGFNGSGFYAIDYIQNIRISGTIPAGSTITVYAR